MAFPFEVEFEEVSSNIDSYVEEVFGSLESAFLTVPTDEGLVAYCAFKKGYEALKDGTSNFKKVTPERLASVVSESPMSLVVLRCMLGFSPPEWAEYASQHTGIKVPQNTARNLDRGIRTGEEDWLSKRAPVTKKRMDALIKSACHALTSGAPDGTCGTIHRLEKIDTTKGLESIRSVANGGVAYSALLYERLLGRPFASLRDSVSERVGDTVEDIVERLLADAGITYHRVGGREKEVPDFDQFPDFLVPGIHEPKVVIEAKVAEDDGTVRDKVTRVQHLDRLSRQGQQEGERKFEVIACIAGRGFGTRRENIRKLIRATRGKVFTLRTINQLVEYTTLTKFRTK